MPIYEFCCQNCQAHFEELVRSDYDPSALKCPRCDSRQISKLISGFSIKSSSGGGAKSCGPCTKTSCSTCG